MTDKDNGGPAFPSENPAEFVVGMTLRDYFAGQALIACRNHSNLEWLSAQAYKIADAMLLERVK